MLSLYDLRGIYGTILLSDADTFDCCARLRAFARLVLSNKDLAQGLDELENKADLMELKHDTFEHNTAYS